MFQKKTDNLDFEIERLKELLTDMDPLDKDYYRLQAILDRAVETRNKDTRPAFAVDGNTWVVAGVNLVGIALILFHENLHPISTKALGFIMKLKP